MKARKTATIATIALYHAYGTGNMVASISYRGKVQKTIMRDDLTQQESQSIGLINNAKQWALANGFTRAVVI